MESQHDLRCIDGGGKTRLFDVLGDIELANVSLIGGMTSDGGGGIRANAGSSVTVLDCVFSNSIAFAGGSISGYDEATVTVQ